MKLFIKDNYLVSIDIERGRLLCKANANAKKNKSIISIV